MGPAVSLPSPYERSVEGREASNLHDDLSWYLEEFLNYSTPPFETAARIIEARNEWGQEVFSLLFAGQGLIWYEDARREGLKYLTLRIASDDPKVLAWPWEALYDPYGSTLAHSCIIERQLNNHNDPQPLPANLPEDRLNILLVVARPYGDEDVTYQALSRPLINLLAEQNLPITVDLLRPPSFDQLQACLEARPGHYHLVHFDGHGGYGVDVEKSSNTPNPHTLRQYAEGCLVFETATGTPQPITAATLTTLMQEHRIPMMVLNACQSAKVDEHAKDPYASVAAALMKAGIRSVVAMGHSLYVSGAEQFVPAFYQNLIKTGQVGEATRAGRKAMLLHPSRACGWYEHDLEDWLVPVLYQQQPLHLPVQNYQPPPPPQLLYPQEATLYSREGFIGRQQQVQLLDRRLRQQPQAGFLIRGMAGIGKTTLAKGYLQWLRDTGGFMAGGEHNPSAWFAGALWYDFEGRTSIEDILSELKTQLFQEQAVHASFKQLIQGLRQTPLLMVWDNFESASSVPGTELKGLLNGEQRQQLHQLLMALRGSGARGTKVLITSRTEETWLGDSLFRLPLLTGLPYHESRDYCNAVVQEQGLSLERDQLNQLQPVIDELGGHPVALRIALQRFNAHNINPEQLLADFRQHYAQQSGSDYSRRMFSAIQLVVDAMPPAWQVLLPWLGLHRGFVDTDYLVLMAKDTQQPLSAELIEQIVPALMAGGLLQIVAINTYRLLPTLSEYCAEAYPAADEQITGFTAFMAALAQHLEGKPLHEQRWPLAVHQSNLHRALAFAEQQDDLPACQAIPAALGHYALNQRQWTLAEHHYQSWWLASQASDDAASQAAACHQLGRVAEERRDFEQAEAWYRKSLVIKEKQGNEHGMATSYHQLGMVAQERRDFEQAEAWCRKSLAIKEKQGNESALAKSYHQLGIVAQERWDFEQAEAWYRKSLAIEEKQGNEHGMATSYHHLGIVAQKWRDFEQAEAWYRKSLAIKEKQDNEHGMAQSYHQLGMVAQERRDFEQAEVWHLKSLAIFEKQGNEHGMATSYHQLGMVAEERRDFEQAEAWYRKSLEIKEKQGNEHGMATSYHQLGSVAEERRDFEQAEAWYRKSLEITEKQGNEHGMAQSYHQLGIVAQERRDFEQAEAWYRKSLAIEEKQGNEHGLAQSYHQLGIVAQARRDFEQAQAWYRKSLAIKEKQGNEHGMGTSFAQLGLMAQEQAQWLEAGGYFIAAIGYFAKTPHYQGMVVRDFFAVWLACEPPLQAQLQQAWLAAGLSSQDEFEKLAKQAQANQSGEA